MELAIGLDIGTSAIKGVLLDPARGVLAEARRATELLRPAQGQVEFSAERCFELVCEAIRELAGRTPPGSKVRGLALSGATGNTCLFDRDLRPLCNVISWMDERAKTEWRELLPDLDAGQVYPLVGWPFGGMFPLAHLAWLRTHEAALYARAAHRLMHITYLYHRLTGRLAIDHSTATTFFLQDQIQGRWHAPYLDMLGLSADELPELLPCGTAIGPLTADAVQRTGLDQAVTVVLGAFDHPSAARAAGVVAPGGLLLSCGTSWVGFYPAADRDLALSQRMLVDPFLQPAGPWGAMFSLAGVGVAIDRLFDELVFQGTRDYALLNRLAGECGPGAEGLSIDPADPAAREPGRLASVRAHHSPAQAARAIMEGVVFAMRGRIEQLASAGMPARSIAMVGGPSESPVWTRIVADVTGLPVRLFGGQAAGAAGAAMLAAAGIGVAVDHRAVAGAGRTVGVDEPGRKQYDKLYRECSRKR